MKKIILIILVLIIAAAGVFFLSQNQTKQASQANGNQVAASFYPLYFFASEIGKEKASVFSVTPNGIEPHDYDPKPQDIIKIQQSKMLLVNGAGFEPWLAKIEPELKSKNVLIVDTTNGLELQHGEEHEEHAGEETATEAAHEEEPLDPHVWLSPVLAKEQVTRITNGYVQVDPQNKAFYEANANALQARLDGLHAKYQAGLQNCQTRDFVTSHAAFSYLANTYNLNQMPISGISPDEEPSTAQLAEISDYVQEHNIGYIFFETLVSPALAQTIANETGAQTLVLDPIEGIPDDEMKQGKNYFTVMEANLSNLQTALGCSQ
jgi:zinc transport system substrate-binding protein